MHQACYNKTKVTIKAHISSTKLKIIQDSSNKSNNKRNASGYTKLAKKLADYTKF